MSVHAWGQDTSYAGLQGDPRREDTQCSQHFQVEETFPDSQPNRLMADGDGTVTRDSLEGCRQFLTENDRVRAFQKINHGDVLKSRHVFELIKSEVVISE